MVTQAPKRSAVFVALAFSLSCVGLIIFVWTQFGGSIPFAAQGYRVRAMFQETGLLVPARDERLLTNALLALTKDAGRRHEMGAAGRDRAQSFGVRAMVEAYEKLFAA